MKDIRKYLCGAASIQYINCAFPKRILSQSGRGPNPALPKMMCEISANWNARTSIFFAKTFEKPDMFLYQIFILFISPSPLSPEATKLNLFKHMTSMILIFNRLKKTHLEILTLNTTECNEKSKTGQVSHVCELHDGGYRGNEQHCCHSYFSHTHVNQE